MSVRLWWGALACGLGVMGGCAGDDAPDAYGNVEAVEITVSPEIGGPLMVFRVIEGQALTAGREVGAVDPTSLRLERDRVRAERAATEAHEIEARRQIPVIDAQRSAADAERQAAVAQRAVLERHLEIAERELARTQRLAAHQAATSQQLDRSERDVGTLEEQIRAQDARIEAHRQQMAVHTGQLAAARARLASASQQTAAAGARLAEVEDRLRRSRIVNPADGTVLATYVERGELVQAGQPLYTIADLTTVDVRGYVTAAQLPAIRVGQAAVVSFDTASGALDSLGGTVSWISSQAEFTPTPIQTRDERADLVYAIKIRVPNRDRRLKIGMPIDVTFPDGR